MQVVFIFLQKYWKQIAVVIVAFIAYRKIRAMLSENVIKNVYPTNGATITNEQAKAYAQRLFLAMEDYGTDEDSIDEVYYLLVDNPYNIRMVYNAFGLKDYGVFGSPSWISSGTPTDLKGWFKNELAGKRLDQWNALFAVAGII